MYSSASHILKYFPRDLYGPPVALSGQILRDAQIVQSQCVPEYWIGMFPGLSQRRGPAQLLIPEEEGNYYYRSFRRCHFIWEQPRVGVWLPGSNRSITNFFITSFLGMYDAMNCQTVKEVEHCIWWHVLNHGSISTMYRLYRPTLALEDPQPLDYLENREERYQHIASIGRVGACLCDDDSERICEREATIYELHAHAKTNAFVFFHVSPVLPLRVGDVLSRASGIRVWMLTMNGWVLIAPSNLIGGTGA